jgi:hypothetical protein
MSPSKESQKNNLDRRPGSIFSGNEQIATNTTTTDPSVAPPASPALVAPEAVIPREQATLPQATVDSRSVEPEVEIDTRLLGEKAPSASPTIAITTDIDTTISDSTWMMKR